MSAPKKKTSSGLSLAALQKRDPVERIEQPRFIMALERALVALHESTDVRDVAEMRDWALAAESYARAVELGDEAERCARETRTRAARKAGELLRQMGARGERRKPSDSLNRGNAGSPVVGGGDHGKPTLADLGISKDHASLWQRMALVEPDVFEKAVKNGEEERTIARRAPDRPRKLRAVPKEKGKRTGPTQRQSLAGLQQAAIALQALAENLDGELFGDWSQLLDVEEAQQWFDILAESLPVVRSIILRTLTDRRKHGH